jgi:hypothetical protein
MAAWRRKVDALFPELRDDLAEDEPLTPHLVFFALLPFVFEAHRRGDEDALRRTYGFAKWCHDARDLENAVAVSFYEHVFDDWSLRREVSRGWILPYGQGSSRCGRTGSSPSRRPSCARSSLSCR